jgi:hypothetical protein
MFAVTPPLAMASTYQPLPSLYSLGVSFSDALVSIMD